ncbi:hypothetical protein C2869_18010 [Saccharobesus litoralis]|uniref:Uncharacterized protein n=1 Tax=Saccharobesus litoralis TaxID=2172099 RepID=A0A2S0VVE7_9ALTE|nr:YheU family protein [Saccharobesus litoralis]AWB68189.1 hypothetical protein C2869_18010 [Saccharobesus litoralis]
MFIDPKLIDRDTLINMAKEWLSRRHDFDSSYTNQTEQAEQVVQALFNKELVITFSNDDEMDQEARLDIRPCGDFNLTPRQINFSV